jgi:hypothetical protein
MTADILTAALSVTWFRKKPALGLHHHSDRGCQHASKAFWDKPRKFGICCSMSRKEIAGIMHRLRAGLTALRMSVIMEFAMQAMMQ